MQEMVRVAMHEAHSITDSVSLLTSVGGVHNCRLVAVSGAASRLAGVRQLMSEQLPNHLFPLAEFTVVKSKRKVI